MHAFALLDKQIAESSNILSSITKAQKSSNVAGDLSITISDMRKVKMRPKLLNQVSKSDCYTTFENFKLQNQTVFSKQGGNITQSQSP